MKKIALILCFLLYAVPCFAEDTMEPVFKQIDDIIIRVESGISLNSYAESLAQIKIDYKKADESGSAVQNPLLSDRMKNVLMYMDDYARAWRWQEIDGKRVVQRQPTYIQNTICRASTRDYGVIYEIPCVKNEILSTIKNTIGTAKSAHYDGW